MIFKDSDLFLVELSVSLSHEDFCYQVENPEEGGLKPSVLVYIPRLEARSRNTFALKQNVQGGDKGVGQLVKI